MLTVNLTGYPQVTLNDKPVPFHTKYEVALLIYLVTQAGPHSRGQLCALLWPDREREYQANSLRVALAHLRVLLGPWFKTTRQTVAVDPAMPLRVQWPEQSRYLARGFSLHPAYDAWLTHQRRRYDCDRSPRWYVPQSESAQSHLEQMALRFYQPTLLGDESAIQWAMRHQATLLAAAQQDMEAGLFLRGCLLLSPVLFSVRRLHHPNPALCVFAEPVAALPGLPAFARAGIKIALLEQLSAASASACAEAWQTLASALLCESHQAPQDLYLAVHAHQTAAKAATLAGAWRVAAEHQQIVVAAVLSQQRPAAGYYLADAAVACARTGVARSAHAYLSLAQIHSTGLTIRRLLHYVASAQQTVETLLSQT